MDKWTMEIRDSSLLVRKSRDLIANGHTSQAQELLPRKRVYPVEAGVARRLGK